MKYDFKMYAYKVLVTHQLTERDLCTRKKQCLQMQQQIPSFATLFFSDDAHFHLYGEVNKQNLRY